MCFSNLLNLAKIGFSNSNNHMYLKGVLDGKIKFNDKGDFFFLFYWVRFSFTGLKELLWVKGCAHAHQLRLIQPVLPPNYGLKPHNLFLFESFCVTLHQNRSDQCRLLQKEKSRQTTKECSPCTAHWEKQLTGIRGSVLHWWRCREAYDNEFRDFSQLLQQQI